MVKSNEHKVAENEMWSKRCLVADERVAKHSAAINESITMLELRLL
jgi:hypothetical protein